MLLVICWCICHFVIVLTYSQSKNKSNLVDNLQTPANFTTKEEYEDITSTSEQLQLPQTWQNSFKFIYSDGRSIITDKNAPFVVVFPYLTKEENVSVQENDKFALWKLRGFLHAMEEFDGATCLQQTSAHDEQKDYERQYKQINGANNNSLDSSWCRFITKKWSLHIKSTGLVQDIQLRKKPLINQSLPMDSRSEEMITLQTCNILQGPFVMRTDAFNSRGGLLDGFGQVTLLEFFIRSRGEPKMAKLSNCAWTREITRVDRATLEGTNDLTEYATFGNKYGILRIVTDSRIEWTTCVANWKLCPEKPYVKPRELPGVAAPICCNAILFQMLKDITWAFTELGVEYRVIYGTLLGAVRSQTVIPWTCDIDIALSKTDYDNATIYSSVVKLLRTKGSRYYLGNSFMDMPRGHMLMAPYIEVDTAPFFDGPDDLQGNMLFSSDIEEAVRGMLPVTRYWRHRGYVDIYWSPSVWMNGSGSVTINNEQFVTVKEIEYELKNWYGQNFREPVLKGQWVGFSDRGTA